MSASKSGAENAHRSIEDEAIELLATTVPNEPDQSLVSLELLDNAAVECAARSRLASELSAELESLHLKRQREGLTEPEAARCAELIRAYERSMLVRAQAAALLKKRGIDVSNLVALL
jgi:hypothetical protein